MIFIFFSALLFGLVHPLSKIILSNGISLYWFCLLYILIRLIAIAPYIILKGHYKFTKKTNLLLLIAIGFVGAFLQLTEFAGIDKGLPVPLVTFLVYTHPVWGIFLSRIINKEAFQWESWLKLSLGIAGIYLILLSSSFTNLQISNPIDLILPIVAGLLISLWVSLSKKLQANNSSVNHFTISFYYDTFGLLTLLGIGVLNNELFTLPVDFISNSSNSFSIIFYSIFIGLLPNLLFYIGINKTTAFAASLILLLEPLIATITSMFLWDYTLSPPFIIGAFFILIISLPFKGILKKIFPATAAILLVATILIPEIASSKDKKIYFIEMAPADLNDNYTTNDELRMILASYELSLQQAKKISPECRVELSKKIEHNSEEYLYKHTKSLSKKLNSNTILVGFSRSSFARLVAKATGPTKTYGISIGAATTDLKKYNSNFYTIASPWISQWEAIHNKMTHVGCNINNTTASFGSDGLSLFFKEEYHKKFKINDKANKNLSCYFIAKNFSNSIDELSSLLKINKKIYIFGIGDWNYHKNELNSLLKNRATTAAIFSPSGWISTLNENSILFSKKLKSLYKLDASPVAAYTYDSMLLAHYSICNGISFDKAIKDSNFNKYLLRNYTQINNFGNFISKMNLIDHGVK